MEIAPTSENAPLEPSAPTAPTPWGFWATTGFSLIVLTTFLVLQVIVAAGYIAISAVLQPGVDLMKVAESASANGLLLSIATWGTMPICLVLVLLFAKLRHGWTVADYLALRPVPVRTILLWLGALLVFCIASDTVTYLIGRPLVPSFMRKVYATAYWTPLLWSALVIAAPAFEEAFFRGFMLRGLRASWLGATGSVLVTSAAWTALHLQYDACSQAILFMVGLLFGAARLKTGSLYPALAMHATMNFLATLEVVLL